MPPPKPRIKNVIEARRWETIRGAWLNNPPTFPHPGARPNPGLENLPPLQGLTFPDSRARFPDVPGVREQLLAEGVFLFHKCAHAHLAAQRLGSKGMHSWSLFNAYHSAYLGARGVMALLGIGLPNLGNGGGQCLIDVYPQPESPKGRKHLAAGRWTFDEFLLVRFPQPLDQQQLWEAYQRVLRASDVTCWDAGLYKEVTEVPCGSITTPRNRYLYKAAFWPGDDLLFDGNDEGFAGLVGTELNADHLGFLLRLSFDVYRLFEQLINDLASESAPIRQELDESRILRDPQAADLIPYNRFVAGRSGGAAQS